MMLACLDAHYPTDGSDGGVAACVVADSWTSSKPELAFTVTFAGVEPYQSGQLYKRELPGLLLALQRLPFLLAVVIVDGFVWLGDHDHPGLGGRLYEALEERCAVVGVAKTHNQAAGPYRSITRGQSAKPLFVSAAGIELDRAAEHVKSMHGEHRVPTLIKLADQLSRREGTTGSSPSGRWDLRHPRRPCQRPENG